jgi:hypothetical protein
MFSRLLKRIRKLNQARLAAGHPREAHRGVKRHGDVVMGATRRWGEGEKGRRGDRATGLLAYAASSSSLCCSQRLTNSSTLTPRFAACLSISLSNSRLTGTVQGTSNSASGASESNPVKSCASQNSPIFSSESALEMLLSFFHKFCAPRRSCRER